MKKLFAFLFAFIFTLSLGFAAYARDTMTKTGAFTFKANDIIGAKVENKDGKSLGTISDLGIDPKDDRVAFAVVTHGGAAGIGGKDIAVPLRALSLRTDDEGKIKMFVLNMSEDRFEDAPSFDKKNWPDRQSAEKSYRYFGQRPYWSGDYKTTTGHMKTDKK